MAKDHIPAQKEIPMACRTNHTVSLLCLPDKYLERRLF